MLTSLSRSLGLNFSQTGARSFSMIRTAATHLRGPSVDQARSSSVFHVPVLRSPSSNSRNLNELPTFKEVVCLEEKPRKKNEGDKEMVEIERDALDQLRAQNPSRTTATTRTEEVRLAPKYFPDHFDKEDFGERLVGQVVFAHLLRVTVEIFGEIDHTVLKRVEGVDQVYRRMCNDEKKDHLLRLFKGITDGECEDGCESEETEYQGYEKLYDPNFFPSFVDPLKPHKPLSKKNLFKLLRQEGSGYVETKIVDELYRLNRSHKKKHNHPAFNHPLETASLLLPPCQISPNHF